MQWFASVLHWFALVCTGLHGFALVLHGGCMGAGPSGPRAQVGQGPGVPGPKWAHGPSESGPKWARPTISHSRSLFQDDVSDVIIEAPERSYTATGFTR